MKIEIGQALKDSSADFIDFVWPTVQPMLGGGDIEAVEAVTAEQTTERLDWLAGIDAWHYLADDGGMRGIASRVQWMDPRFERLWPWRTFTVRRSTRSGRPTEYDKRLAALRKSELGLLYPHLTVQAYVRVKGEGPLDAVGIVRTCDLIDYIESGSPQVRNAPSGETFFVVPWDDLSRSGLRVGEATATSEAA